jgi:hypothetical protein
MAAERFRSGDRVRLRAGCPVAKAGTAGTIQFVYRSVVDLYEIRFDGHTRAQMMRACELEPVDRERSM